MSDSGEYLNVSTVSHGINFVCIAGSTHEGYFKILMIRGGTRPIETLNISEEKAKWVIEEHAPGYVEWEETKSKEDDSFAK